MSLSDLQPEACAAFDAVCGRAGEVVDVDLMSAVRERIRQTLTGEVIGDRTAGTAREIDCLALVDQMLVDVSMMSDETVAAAGRHFATGGLWDFVAASYLTEASIRLDIASTRLLGGRG